MLAFSILLLVPVGAQNAFANHPTIPSCPPPGDLITNPNFQSVGVGPAPFCQHSAPLLAVGFVCTPPYIGNTVFDSTTGAPLYNACTAPVQQIQDQTLSDQCQDKATLVGNHCVPDLSQVCGSGTIPQNLMCIAQSMGSMIGGSLLEINSVSLLVGAIGTNPIITGLVGITIAGITGQAVWFIHKTKKNNS